MNRPLLLVLALLAGCPSEPPSPEAEAPGASSVATRWLPVERPSARSLLQSPAVTRAGTVADGEVAMTSTTRLDRLLVRPGSPVEVGDPVFEGTAPQVLEAAAAWAGARRRLAVLDDRTAALEAAAAESLVPASAVFEHRATVAGLRAELDRASAVLAAAGVPRDGVAALLDRGRLVARAPVSGVVVEVSGRTGEVIEPGTPVVRIVGSGAPRVEVRSPGTWPQLGALRFVALDGRSLSLAPEPVSSVVDPHDGSRVSWFDPLEDASFEEGVVGTVFAEATDAWQVPAAAVSTSPAGSTVVRRRGELVERVPVEVVTSSGAAAIVRGPFAPGDTVAEDGDLATTEVSS